MSVTNEGTFSTLKVRLDCFLTKKCHINKHNFYVKHYRNDGRQTRTDTGGMEIPD